MKVGDNILCKRSLIYDYTGKIRFKKGSFYKISKLEKDTRNIYIRDTRNEIWILINEECGDDCWFEISNLQKYFYTTAKEIRQLKLKELCSK